MKDTFSLLGVKAETLSAKEAMRAFLALSETEEISIVEILTEEVLVENHLSEKTKNNIEKSDMVFVGDEAVLKAVGETDGRTLRDARKHVFLKMILRLLREQKAKVFLVAESPERLMAYKGSLRCGYSAIEVTGEAVICAERENDSALVNTINGLEVDAVLSEISSAEKENFGVRNRDVLDVSMWIRTGKIPDKWGNRPNLKKSFKYFCRKHLLWKALKKENKEED